MGGLNSDVDPKDVRQGDLFVSGVNTGGVNVRSSGRGLNVSPDYEAIYGNEYVYEPTALAVQNKLFRLEIDVTNAEATSDFTFTLSTPSGNILLTYSDTFDSSLIANALSDIDGFLQSELAPFGINSTTTQTGSLAGYIDFEFSSAPYFNYVFAFSVTSGDSLSSVVILQEGVDPSMLGDWNLLGSDDKTGDKFEFWTTRNGLPSEVEILNITNPASTTVRVETVTAHGLLDNMSVRIKDVVGVSEANGIWTVSVVSATVFDLNLAVFIGPTYISGGFVVTSIYGVGEIGVSVKDNNGVISYTRLLRSIEFNFSTLHQIDCRVKRKQDSRYAVYFTESRGDETIETDSTNVPRVFYYKGIYVTDGALTIVSSDNIYQYGGISSELGWIIGADDFYIEFDSQIQSGGQVKSGNWRYAARLLTNDLSPTNWSQLTEGVPVFIDPISSPFMIGDPANVTTPKINVLRLVNNTVDLYKYVEVAAVNYFSTSSMTGYIIGRYTLEQKTIQFISHTGTEQAILDLDIGTLNEFLPGFFKAQNVELLDNRSILTNLTPIQVFDFTEFVRTFRYRIDREILNPIGEWPNDSFSVNEYKVPDNVYSKKSHMMMETYRYGFRFKLKTGSITQVFYPGYDIKIDLPATPYPPERDAGSFTTFDLTDNNAPPTEVYSLYLTWLNINLDYLINGVKASDLISEIIPCRATVNPTVIAHGAIIMGVDGAWGGTGYFGTNPPGDPFAIGPYPHICGVWDGSDVYPGNYTGVRVTPPLNYNEQRTSAFFYTPDVSFRKLNIQYRAGDQIISFGAPQRHAQLQYPVGAPPYGAPDFIWEPSYYAEFSGHTGITTNVTGVDIIAIETIDTVTNGIGLGKLYNPLNISINGQPHNTSLKNYGPTGERFLHDRTTACVLQSGINNSGSVPHTDYGFYRAIYYRPLADPYGNPLDTQYTEQLPPYRLTPGASAIIVAGDFKTYGDVFTQKTYLKYRYPGWFDRLNPSYNDGNGVGFGYYSQNRNNLQLRCKPTETWSNSAVIQELNVYAWIVFGYAEPGTLGYSANGFNYVPIAIGIDSQLHYNSGYTPSNNIIALRAYNVNAIFQTDWGNAVAWSQIEAEGSNTDNLRIFPPLNLKFLDYTFGPITNALDYNGELITIQPRSVQRQYFNTTALMTTLDGSEVELGSGAVMSRRGSVMNKYGSSHKWSMFKGLSDRGHDVLYGVDDINKTVWRLGYDGTTTLDELSGMHAFFANHLSWIRGKFTPAYDQGIRGVANQRYREAIWTMRGRKEVPQWTDRDEIVTLLDFSSVLGSELIIGSLFSGSLYGWISEDNTHTPDATIWQWNAGSGAPYAFIAPGDDGYLRQDAAVALVSGTPYRVLVKVVFSPLATTPLEIAFQLGGPVEFSITASGEYYFAYIAQPGDDNMYFYHASPVTAGPLDCSILHASIQEVLTATSNWSGYPTWLIANNDACADGSDGDNLVHNSTSIIVPGVSNILDFIVHGVTTGDVTAVMSDVSDSPVSANGNYQFIGTPTVAGAISFIPTNNFDGCIKGNIRHTAIITKRYNPGDVVSVPGNNFHNIPDYYIALVETGGSLPTPENEDWQILLHSDPNYFNYYTIVFSELKNKFQLFAQFLPKIYAKFLDGYMVPRPVSNTGRMYVNDSGLPTTWFAQDTSVLTGDAYFDAVINYPEGRKRFLAIRVESDSAPTRVTVTTPTGNTFMLNSDFVQREGNEFDAAVKNNLTSTGFNDQDTSILQGDWGIFRFIIGATTYNKINSFISKLRPRSRTPNT